MYNELFYNDDITLSKAIEVSKKTIGISEPYIIDVRFGGEEVVIFSDHFILTYREALSQNCTANMTTREKQLYIDFLKYKSHRNHGNMLEPEATDKVLEALDQWTLDELMGNPHPDYKKCS